MNKHSLNKQIFFCPLALMMDIIGGKRKTMFLYHLQWGPMRSGEIKHSIKGDISTKMFTQIARELERDKVVRRIVYPVVPPKVECELTPLGEKLIPNINNLVDLGRKLAQSN